MKKLLALIAGLALAGSAAAGGSHKLDYSAYATGESVNEISYFQLYNWQRSTDKQVVLWTKPSTAYMVTLAHTCDGLRGVGSRSKSAARARSRVACAPVMTSSSARSSAA